MSRRTAPVVFDAARRYGIALLALGSFSVTSCGSDSKSDGITASTSCSAFMDYSQADLKEAVIRLSNELGQDDPNSPSLRARVQAACDSTIGEALSSSQAIGTAPNVMSARDADPYYQDGSDLALWLPRNFPLPPSYEVIDYIDGGVHLHVFDMNYSQIVAFFNGGLHAASIDATREADIMRFEYEKSTVVVAPDYLENTVKIYLQDSDWGS